MKKLINILRLAAAFIFVLIGAVGLLVPVFPTVPFLIIAAVIMGKKPGDIMKFLKHITFSIRLRLKRTIRRLRKKRLSKYPR